MKATALSAVALAACSPSPPPPVAAPKAPPRPQIDELVGVRLGTEVSSFPYCGAPLHEKQEALPCVGRDDSGLLRESILLPEGSVPPRTMARVEIETVDGRIGSISLATFLPAEEAVPMLVDKWGPANGDDDPLAVRWMGQTAEALFMQDSPSRGEHRILVQSFAHTAHQNASRAAEKATRKGF